MSKENKAELNGHDEQMTMRDIFALAAMQGFSANSEMASFPCERVARMAYEQADEMLKARKQ